MIDTKKGHESVKNKPTGFKENDKEINEGLKNERYGQDTKLKIAFFRFVLLFSTTWTAYVGYLVYQKAFNDACRLSDTVACALLSSSLVTVLGLPMITAKHFFQRKL